MICINCHHQDTRVTNSRPRKKTAQIWRRRRCSHCQTVFTTYERPALHEEVQVRHKNGQLYPFNAGRLFIDIMECLEATETKYDDTLWLVKSIEDALMRQFEKTITTSTLKEVTYDVISHFHRSAGIQYAARHNMINKLQRGRPPKR